MLFEGKRILITGGTGSLGKVLTRRLLERDKCLPESIIIYSRDEAKQHQMRLDYLQKSHNATDEIIYNNFHKLLKFRIGDVRDLVNLSSVLQEVDIVINAAALKQVPSCEYFPIEAVQTNVMGAANIVKAIQIGKLKIETVVGVSTDKACKPINAMGMTKAVQERIFISGNLNSDTRFVCVRYGNVLSSRGSVIPLFFEQIKQGGPITITTKDMTRFLLPLNHAVDTIFEAINHASKGEIYIPKIKSAYMTDVAAVLIGDKKIDVEYSGIRPGEKIDEILISNEESRYTIDKGDYYAITSLLPEISNIKILNDDTWEYSSGDPANLMDRLELKELLEKNNLLDIKTIEKNGEILR